MIVFECHKVGMTSKRRNLERTCNIGMKEKTWKTYTLPLYIDRKWSTMDLAMHTTRTDNRSCLTERWKTKNSLLGAHVSNCSNNGMSKSSVPALKTRDVS